MHFGLSEQQLKAALALVEWEVLVNLRQERASEFAAAAWEPLFDWAAQDAAIKRRDDRLRVLFLSPRGGDVEGAAAPAAAPVADKADAKTGQIELKQADTSSQAPKLSRFVASDDALEELNNRYVGCVEAFALETRTCSPRACKLLRTFRTSVVLKLVENEVQLVQIMKGFSQVPAVADGQLAIVDEQTCDSSMNDSALTVRLQFPPPLQHVHLRCARFPSSR